MNTIELIINGKQIKRNIYFYFLGTKFSIRFICEVSVTGHNYIGVGNSTNKKDAQGNASKDFLSYLTRQGLVSADSLPAVSTKYINLNL